MKIPKETFQTIGSIVLLLTLFCTGAYVFSQENIFRPPQSRSRLVAGSRQAESKTELAQSEPGDREKSGRLQMQELLYIVK